MSDELKCDMAIRDLMSAAQSLDELPYRFIRDDIEDIELAHSRLGKLIENFRQNEAEAAWERHCEDFHDGGSTSFKSLREQQIEAMRFK